MRLSPTSYVVLGLVEFLGTATPYDLKRLAQLSVFNFWPLPHTQLYTESARLAEGGLLSERRETEGRRRRIYRITDEGRAALERWRAEPADTVTETRDAGVLKLFLGADPRGVAERQLEAHRRQLEAYERIHASQRLPDGMRLALEGGIVAERGSIRYWEAVRDGRDALGAIDPA